MCGLSRQVVSHGSGLSTGFTVVHNQNEIRTWDDTKEASWNMWKLAVTHINLGNIINFIFSFPN